MALLLALAATAVVGRAASQAPPVPGEIGPQLGVTGNGRVLRPAGRMTTVGDFPTGGALSPDGRFYWTVSAGHGHDDVQIVDVASGRVTQVLALPGAYVGVAFSPDGRTAYVSGEPTGNGHPTGVTRGAGGDVIHVFAVDPATGIAEEQSPIGLPKTTGGTAESHAGTVIPGFPAPPGPTQGAPLGWPEGMAVSPDGSTLVVALNQADQAAIIDLRHGNQISLVKTGAYPYSVAITRDGASAYVTNEYDGTVSVIGLASKRVTSTIALGSPGGDRSSHPEGIIADPHRDRVYVAVTNRDLVAAIDTSRRAVIARVSVADPAGTGAEPVALAIAPDGATLYSADAGEDAVSAISLAARGPAGSVPGGYTVRRIPRLGGIVRFDRVVDGLASRLGARLRHAGSRSAQRHLRAVYRRHVARLRRALGLGAAVRRSCSGPSTRQSAAYVSAVVRAYERRERGLARLARSRVSRRGRRLAERRLARRYRAAIVRAQRRLPRIATCRSPVGAIPSLPAFTLIGKIPTAAYTTDVQVSPDGAKLIWLAAKGLGAGPNPNYGTPFAHSEAAPYGQYVLDRLLGRVGVLARPSDRQASALSSVVAAVLRPDSYTSPPAGTPVIGPGGGPSTKIKYVFYVVKENRTYDQIFGSDPRGDGDPRLEVFDDNNVHTPAGGVTPNAHALTRTFPLLDHFYADSEVSVDGHQVTAGAYATDYVQKALAANYANRGRVDEFGTYPVSFPPNDYIFDQAVRQGVPFRNYGEISAGDLPSGNDGRSTYPAVAASTMFSYPLFFACDGNPIPPNGANNRVVCDTDSGTKGPTGNLNVSNSRFDYFQNQFNSEVAAGTVPAFNYLTLPNDHTNGVQTNYPTPAATVADNDLGLGQLVDLISHSPIWSQSAIFVTEDDSQDGADHVDAHRMPAYVISPWARRGAVVHTRYDQDSMLRTMELILGLHPLSLFDGSAAPMWDAFSSRPDLRPYTAIQPQQSLTAVTTAAQAHAAGKLAGALPYRTTDLVPQALFDQIIWRSVYGPHSPPPPPGPDASPQEAARAAGALAVFNTGGDVAGYLRQSTPAGDQNQGHG